MKRAVPLSEVSRDGCMFAVTPHDAGPRDHRFCNEPVIPGASWCPKHAKKVGMTQKDMDRLAAKKEKAKAHADARRNRTAIDFASHAAKRQDNGGIAI